MEEKKITRCKFKCHEITQRVGWSGNAFIWSARFGVVVEGSEENKQFFAATPSGSLEIGTIRSDFFEVGTDYYIDVIEA